MRAVASLCVSYCRIVFCQLECLSRARVGSPSCVCLFFLKYVQGLFFLKYVPVETLLSARPLLAMVSQDMMFALVLCTLVAQLLAPLGDVIINLEIQRQLCLMAAFGLLVIIGFVLGRACRSTPAQPQSSAPATTTAPSGASRRTPAHAIEDIEVFLVADGKTVHTTGGCHGARQRELLPHRLRYTVSWCGTCSKHMR